MPFDLQAFSDLLQKGASLSGNRLAPEQIALMSGHAKALSLWNKKINLTAIRDTRSMAEKHFIDTVCICPFLRNEFRIMDMGTGGGFPAIPLKVLNPDMTMTMVDSVRKKVNFLNHVVRTLKLENIWAVHTRVEELAEHPDHSQTYDAVVSRGFADLDKFVSLAVPMLKPGGRIYALKGGNAQKEISAALQAQFDIAIHHYRLPFSGADRYLISMVRLAD